VAALVNDGRGEELFPPWRETLPLFGGEHVVPCARASALRFRKVELLDLDGTDERERFFERWLEERVRAVEGFEALAGGIYPHDDRGFSGEAEGRLRRLLAHWEGFRILCVTRGRGRPTGAEAVSAHLHERLRPAGSTGVFAPGEPVLMQENDYQRGLFNGDQGVVARVAEPGAGPRPMAVFPTVNGLTAFPLESLRGRLALGHAMTVHKAQGSEFDHVALLLPDEDIPLSTREILYTAITRARTAVTIVGRRELLVAAVGRQIVRYSGIAETLAQPMPQA
jgi:exodeoxyribonuclease V alpha subunit